MQAGIELPTEIYTLEFRNSLPVSKARQENFHTPVEHSNSQRGEGRKALPVSESEASDEGN